MKEVTAAVIVRNQKVLIAQRPAGKSLAHYWEFPGGKLEVGETLPQCLKRELKEELNLDATIGSFITASRFEYEFGTINLNAFFVSIAPDIEVRSNEHEQIKWISLAEFDNYQFPPADVPIVEALKKLKLG